MNIVGIDSSHEPATRAVSRHRSKSVYPHFRARGFRVSRFSGKRALRALVAPAVAGENVEYVTGVGHGLFDSYLGHNYAPVFQVGQYAAAEAKAKVMHLLSCLTAISLGPDLVTKGTQAYFGYDEYFTFEFQDRSTFLDCDAEIDRGFAEGLTAAQVYQRAYNAYTAAILEERRKGRDYIASILEFNRDHLCAPSIDPRFGSTTARLPNGRKKPLKK